MSTVFTKSGGEYHSLLVLSMLWSEACLFGVWMRPASLGVPTFKDALSYAAYLAQNFISGHGYGYVHLLIICK